MMKVTLALIWSTAWIGALAWSADSAAVKAASIKASVQTVIQMHHPEDDQEWWTGLGASAPAVICQMIRENEEKKRGPYERIRLIEGLGWYKETAGDDTIQFLKAIYETDPNSLVKDAAMRSITLLRGAKEKAYLENYLAKTGSHQKVRVAQLLDESGESQARAMVDRLLATESNKNVVSKIKAQRKARESEDQD